MDAKLANQCGFGTPILYLLVNALLTVMGSQERYHVMSRFGCNIPTLCIYYTIKTCSHNHYPSSINPNNQVPLTAAGWARGGLKGRCSDPVRKNSCSGSAMPLSAAKHKTNDENTEIQQSLCDNVKSLAVNEVADTIEVKRPQQSQVMQDDDRTSVAADASAELPESFIQMAIDVDGTVSILLSGYSQNIFNPQHDEDFPSTPQSSTGYSSDTVFQLPNGYFCFQMKGGGGGGVLVKSRRSSEITEMNDKENEPQELQQPKESSHEFEENEEQKQPTHKDLSHFRKVKPYSVIINDSFPPESEGFDPFGIPTQPNEIASVFYHFVIAEEFDYWSTLVKNRDEWRKKCKEAYTQLATVNEDGLRNIIMEKEFAGREILESIHPCDHANLMQLMCRIFDKKSCAVWATALKRNGELCSPYCIPVTNETFKDTVRKHLTRGIALSIGLQGNAGGDHWFTITGYGDKITITQSWQYHYDIKNQTLAASEFFELMKDILNVKHLEAVDKLFGPPDGSGFRKYARLMHRMVKFEVGKPLVAGRGTDAGQTPTGLSEHDDSNFI